MLKLIKRKNKVVSIKEHYLRKNKVLIKRRVGGFGDIVMQRMMMEDFAKTGLDICYSCPFPFIEIMKNHPYLKEIKSLSEVKDEDYGMIYDITTICAVTESSLGNKNKKHRSDIWANYCGIELNKHETYLTSDIEDLEFYKKEIKKINIDSKKIIFLSLNATNNNFGESKSLNEEQIISIIKKLKDLNYFIITASDCDREIYNKLNIKQFIKLNIKQWISLIDACDFIISVDTASFHIAGALKKPLLGIFGFTDGKVYGKYYDFVLVQKHRDNGNWPCGPCFNYHGCLKDKINIKKPCITELTVEEIIDGFKKLVDINQKIIKS